MTNYQVAKVELKEIQVLAKNQFKNDLPAIRQTINDSAYYISGERNLTAYQANLLHNYAAKLHPKR
jgi:hypothetical protein